MGPQPFLPWSLPCHFRQLEADGLSVSPTTQLWDGSCIHRMRCLVASVMLIAGSATQIEAGVPGKAALYRGGTLPIPEATRGKVSTLDPVLFSFRHKFGDLKIPYTQVNALEYGQKASRRLGLAIVVSPVFLLSKKRKHYLTINYVDNDGFQQAAVFEIGKKIIRTTLAGLEARTGRKVEYQDEEARKASER